MLSCDAYLMPASLDEAFAAMESHRGRYRLVAGATDTLPWAREGRAGDVAVPVLIDIAKIPELNERRIDGGTVRIGAATPLQRFLDDPALAAAMPCMPRCAVWFADDQIREQATIGGNLVNASPAADGTPPLLAHDAGVELAAWRGSRIIRRTMPLEQFLLGPGKTALQSDEILLAITANALPGYGGDFEKVGHRRSLVIAVVCLAVLVKLDGGKRRIVDARLAVGGIGPVPSRLREVERMLCAEPLSEALLRRAAAVPVELVRSRSRQDYRRDVVEGFVMRGLVNAIRRGGGDVTAMVPDLEASYA
jgi:xanthine dehydrogenase FAD-binding subunit